MPILNLQKCKVWEIWTPLATTIRVEGYFGSVTLYYFWLQFSEHLQTLTQGHVHLSNYVLYLRLGLYYVEVCDHMN